MLKSVCPTYDQSVTRNDEYRLHKAFVYAICSDGTTFKRQIRPSADQLE